MPITQDDVIRTLSSEEPDYERAAMRLGAEALPHLHELSRGSEPLLAAKAVVLAAMIDGAGASPTLAAAAQRREPQIRVAVAAIARKLAARPAAALLQQLLADDDPGVRKVAIRSTASTRAGELNDKLRELAAQDPSPHNQRIARRVLAGAIRRTPR